MDYGPVSRVRGLEGCECLFWAQSAVVLLAAIIAQEYEIGIWYYGGMSTWSAWSALHEVLEILEILEHLEHLEHREHLKKF